MRRSFVMFGSVLGVLAVGLAACDDDPVEPPTNTFSLTVEGDETFQDPHGDDAVHLYVEDSGGDIVESESGTVSPTEGPAFSFTINDALEEDQDYTIIYWIDSGTDGTEGVCDEDVDYLERTEITSVSEDQEVTASFDGEAETSCDDFAYTLELSGDDSFQDAHAGDPIQAAVVHEGLDAVVATRSGTVAEDGDVSFSLTFEGVLTRGADYHVDYWIDSNLDDGTEGTCDEPDDDHQWRIDTEAEEDLGAIAADVSIEDSHRPDDVEDVCSSFE